MKIHLEPVCCKKQPKIVPDHSLVLNGTKLTLDNHGNNLGSFRISSGPSEVPLLLKPVTGQEMFLAVSYSKPALEQVLKFIYSEKATTFC